MKKTTRFLSFVLVVILCLSVLPLSAAAASEGWVKDTYTYDGETYTDWYYYRNGSPITGWEKISGTWYYFVPDWGGVMLTGWLNTDPTYFQENGTANGDWYHFSDSGAMETSKWIKATDYDSEGNVTTYWYYQLSSGRGAMGWQKIGGVWYYFDPDNYGVMEIGLKDIGETSYYFKSSGAMATGWQKIEGDWYYFNSSGAMRKSSWLKSGGSWYYFGSDGKMYTGPKTISGTKYYFKSSGAMKTGWQKIDSDWYYFNSSGAMRKASWLKSGGKWYYFMDDGVMAAGVTLNIGGTNYTFNASGVWVS